MDNTDEQEAEIELELARTFQRVGELQWQLLQIRTERQRPQIVPADSISHDNQNHSADLFQEPPLLLDWQITPTADTSDPPPPLQFVNLPGDLLPIRQGDSTQARRFEPPWRTTELPSNFEGVDNGELGNYTYVPANDGGISPTVDYSLTFSSTLPFDQGVDDAEPAAGRIAAPSPANQTTQVPSPRPESPTLAPKRHCSVPDQRGFGWFIGNEQVFEQAFNLRRANRIPTQEEHDKTEAVKRIGACHNCKSAKKRCSGEIPCNRCIKAMEAHCDNLSLRLICIRPLLHEDFFYTKCMEFASQATGESIRVDPSTVPGSAFTETCERLQALIPRNPFTVHQCCSRAELYYLTEEPAWVQYAHRWKSMWHDRKSLLPSKQYCSAMLQICTTIITYCETGLQSDRIPYLSFPAIGW